MTVPRRLVLACGGLRRALEDLEPQLEVRFLDPELHRSPRRTRAALQGRLDRIRDVEQVALAWGLCGGAVVGLRCDAARLVLPRVHDCLGLLLAGEREPGSYLLAAGWLEGRQDPLGILEDRWVPRVGRAEAERTVRRQFAGYRRLVLVDSGLDRELRARAARNAELLELPLEERPGDTRLLRRLVAGEWDERDFVFVPPGQEVTREAFLSGPAAPSSRG